MNQSLISGSLQAITVISNAWQQSCRFYSQGLGYTSTAYYQREIVELLG